MHLAAVKLVCSKFLVRMLLYYLRSNMNGLPPYMYVPHNMYGRPFMLYTVEGPHGWPWVYLLITSDCVHVHVDIICMTSFAAPLVCSSRTSYTITPHPGADTALHWQGSNICNIQCGCPGGNCILKDGSLPSEG